MLKAERRRSRRQYSRQGGQVKPTEVRRRRPGPFGPGMKMRWRRPGPFGPGMKVRGCGCERDKVRRHTSGARSGVSRRHPVAVAREPPPRHETGAAPLGGRAAPDVGVEIPDLAPGVPPRQFDPQFAQHGLRGGYGSNVSAHARVYSVGPSHLSHGHARRGGCRARNSAGAGRPATAGIAGPHAARLVEARAGTVPRSRHRRARSRVSAVTSCSTRRSGDCTSERHGPRVRHGAASAGISSGATSPVTCRCGGSRMTRG